MDTKKQKTIKKEISLEGVGVHSGRYATVYIRPAQANSGITIMNKAFPDKPLVLGAHVPEAAMHATVIKLDTWAISTIEHVLAALSGMEIDNATVEIEGFEVPILDGSALPFVHAINRAGIEELSVARKFLTPKETLFFEEDGRTLEVVPAKQDSYTLSFEYSTDFDHHLIRDKKLTGTLSPAFFAKEIAPARTFGFLNQLPFLRKHGLALGSTLGNTVVIGEEECLNALRFKDEFIRHKLLDLIGDLTLLGRPLAGTIKAHKTGHNFNRKVIEHYITYPEMWNFIAQK